jgi:hypothetical protein
LCAFLRLFRCFSTRRWVNEYPENSGLSFESLRTSKKGEVCFLSEVNTLDLIDELPTEAFSSVRSI